MQNKKCGTKVWLGPSRTLNASTKRSAEQKCRTKMRNKSVEQKCGTKSAEQKFGWDPQGP